MGAGVENTLVKYDTSHTTNNQYEEGFKEVEGDSVNFLNIHAPSAGFSLVGLAAILGSLFLAYRCCCRSTPSACFAWLTAHLREACGACFFWCDSDDDHEQDDADELPASTRHRAMEAPAATLCPATPRMVDKHVQTRLVAVCVRNYSAYNTTSSPRAPTTTTIRSPTRTVSTCTPPQPLTSHRAVQTSPGSPFRPSPWMSRPPTCPTPTSPATPSPPGDSTGERPFRSILGGYNAWDPSHTRAWLSGASTPHVPDAPWFSSPLRRPPPSSRTSPSALNFEDPALILPVWV